MCANDPPGAAPDWYVPEEVRDPLEIRGQSTAVCLVVFGVSFVRLDDGVEVREGKLVHTRSGTEFVIYERATPILAADGVPGIAVFIHPSWSIIPKISRADAIRELQRHIGGQDSVRPVFGRERVAFVDRNLTRLENRAPDDSEDDGEDEGGSEGEEVKKPTKPTMTMVMAKSMRTLYGWTKYGASLLTKRLATVSSSCSTARLEWENNTRA